MATPNKHSAEVHTTNAPFAARQHRIFARLKFLHSTKRSVSRQLLFSIILFSSFVTLVATSIQLYTDYERDVSIIDQRLDEIETSYLDSISASLWNMDIRQIELLLEGIKRFSDVSAVELIETEKSVDAPFVISMGKKGQHSTITRTFPIVYSEDGNAPRQLGTLYVETTLEEVYDRLRKRGIVILFSQGIKTFLVSMFILYLFHRLVTRHLEHISEHVRNINPSKPIPTLKLDRPHYTHLDELDDVVNAYNALGKSLMSAYEELIDTNVTLEEDIIARRQAEDEVRRLNEDLEQRVFQRTSELEAANSELGAFCYSVSHDLRSPLRRIEGFRQLLNEKYADKIDHQGLHYLQRIEAGTHEMSEMIDSFLKLSRATNTKLSMERINLSEMVEKIVLRLRERDPLRHIDIHIQKDIYTDGDKRLLDIMLSNLIENAWKYTQETARPKIDFGCLQTAGNPVYFVKDNGVGFDVDFSKHLFKPFIRLHTKNENFDGVGVGLATVHRIIARHGGKVWFDAKIDQGAIFYFSLWDRGVV